MVAAAESHAAPSLTALTTTSTDRDQPVCKTAMVAAGGGCLRDRSQPCRLWAKGAETRVAV